MVRQQQQQQQQQLQQQQQQLKNGNRVYNTWCQAQSWLSQRAQPQKYYNMTLFSLQTLTGLKSG